jgi:hypothetical protein
MRTMPNKKTSGDIVTNGDRNNIKSITNNSKKQYNLRLYAPLVLTASLTIGVTIGTLTGVIKLPKMKRSEPPQAGSTLPTKNKYPQSKSQIHILDPRTKSELSRKSNISGSFENLTSEENLWVYVFAEGEKAYYPSIVRDIDFRKKTWKVQVTIGNTDVDQSGNTWKIGTIVLGEQESNILREITRNGNGAPKLPVPIDPGQEIVVLRKPLTK